MKLTLAEFKEAYPEMYHGIFQDGFDKGSAEAHTKGKAEGVKEGAETERSRIKAVEDQLIPGHEALIADLKYDGKTTGPEAAVKVLAAEKTLRATKLAEFTEEHAKTAAPAVPKDDKRAPQEDDASLPPEERAKKTWDADPAVRAEFKNDFDAYKAFVVAEAAGQVKIYRGGK